MTKNGEPNGQANVAAAWAFVKDAEPISYLCLAGNEGMEKTMDTVTSSGFTLGMLYESSSSSFACQR